MRSGGGGGDGRQNGDDGGDENHGVVTWVWNDCSDGTKK